MAITVFRYSRPDESIIGANVTGTVDADFSAAALTDGVPGLPVKTTGDLALAATPLAATPIGIVAVCNHTVVPANTVDITGAMTETITVPAVPANNIPLNYYTLRTESSVSGAINVGVTGNGVPVVIGEFWAGKVRTLERGLKVDATMAPPPPYEWEGEFGSLPPNDPGVEARTLTGTAVVSDTGLADIEAWYRSTRRGTLPSLIIPFEGVNDAWLVTFSYSVTITWKHPTSAAGSIYQVAFDFKEVSRTEW